MTHVTHMTLRGQIAGALPLRTTRRASRQKSSQWTKVSIVLLAGLKLRVPSHPKFSWHSKYWSYKIEDLAYMIGTRI